MICRWPSSPCAFTHVSGQMSSYKDTSHTELGPILKTSFLFKDLTSKYGYIPRYWGSGLQHMNLGGWAQFSPKHFVLLHIFFCPTPLFFSLVAPGFYLPNKASILLSLTPTRSGLTQQSITYTSTSGFLAFPHLPTHQT